MRLVVEIPDATLKEFKDATKQNSETMAQVIRRAIDGYLRDGGTKKPSPGHSRSGKST